MTLRHMISIGIAATAIIASPAWAGNAEKAVQACKEGDSRIRGR